MAKISKSTLDLIKQNIYCSQISKNKLGNLIFRKGYFYRMGHSAESFSETISKSLNDLNLKFQIVSKGDIFKPFKGGASVKSQSHFFVEVSIID